MASLYSINGGLSLRTEDAYIRHGGNQLRVKDRLEFYLAYLQDVVPGGVAVVHIPRNIQPFDLRLSEQTTRAPAHVEREEIQLRYDGRIFMTCVLSLDFNPTTVEEVAGHLAYVHWRDGYFVRDYHRAWRMFTALNDLRFFSSRHGNEWDRTAIFDPIVHARDVAAYLQRELARSRLP